MRPDPTRDVQEEKRPASYVAGRGSKQRVVMQAPSSSMIEHPKTLNHMHRMTIGATSRWVWIVFHVLPCTSAHVAIAADCHSMCRPCLPCAMCLLAPCVCPPMWCNVLSQSATDYCHVCVLMLLWPRTRLCK